MALPKPDLDDRTFAQLVDDARAMIPRVAPSWTDHNVHDPGITFVELFAWLAEIQQYRLNRVAEQSFLRFLQMAAVSRTPLQPATASLSIALDRGAPGGFVPAGERVGAIGREEVPFVTTRDRYLTASAIVSVRTVAAGRETDQTRANDDPAAHFAAFGPNPVIGDALYVGVDPWFVEPEIELYVEIHDAGLPSRVELAPDPTGFIPSATLVWEYGRGNSWQPLPVLEDGTLAFSRSGRIRFVNPGAAGAVIVGAPEIRGRLESGRYEIPPAIASIATNTLEVQQVERIVNEDLGAGFGTPDQVRQLRKRPPLLTGGPIGARPFAVGDLLDPQTLIMRLARPEQLHRTEDVAPMRRLAARLSLDQRVAGILGDPSLTDRSRPDFRPPRADEVKALAHGLDRLLDDEALADAGKRARVDAASGDTSAADQGHCPSARELRRRNGAVLASLLRDQIAGERLEVQVGIAATLPEEEPRTWTTWDRVEDFSRSAPQDLHYLLDTDTGEIRFGNGLNGRVPQPSERIRARMYSYSAGADGDLGAGHTWRFASPRLSAARGTNRTPASGGASTERLEAAAARARRDFRAISRAITAADYVELAARTPGLRMAQVKVLPGHNPRIPCVTIPGHVTVAVLPFAPTSASRPQPSQGFLETVRHHLSAVRLAGTVLHVVGPDFVPVSVHCSIALARGAKANETRERLRALLDTFLDPIRGGVTGSGWPFGRAVFPSEIHALLMRDAAVAHTSRVAINGLPPDKPLPLPPTAVPVPEAHVLDVVPFERGREGGTASSRATRQREHGHA